MTQLIYSLYYIQYAFREWKYRMTTEVIDDFWNAINIGYYQNARR